MSNGEPADIKNVVIRLFQESSRNLERKKIIRHVRSHFPQAQRKQVKKALKQLEAGGKITRVVG